MRIVALALVVVSAAGCRFSVAGSPADLATGSDVDMTNVDPSDLSAGDDLAQLPDLALPPDLLVPGILSGARADTMSFVDISIEGVVDWAHFGLNTVTDVNRKAGGPAAVIESAIGTPGQYSLYDPALSWSGGTPTASVTTNSGIFMRGVNSAFSITVPADTTTRTLSVYLSQYHSTATLLAHLSDGAAPDFSMKTTIGLSNVYHRYTITFRASHPGQTLRVSWTLTTDAGNGTVDLMAATYY